MSDNPSTPHQQEPTKKRSILAIGPAKARVETSVGPLFVRHAYVSDYERFGSDDDTERGRLVVQRLASRVERKGDDTPFDGDVGVLTESDLSVLIPAIAKQSGWKLPEPSTGLQGLGQSSREAEKQVREEQKRMLEEIRKAFKADYGFLEPTTLSKLEGQLLGLPTQEVSLADRLPKINFEMPKAPVVPELPDIGIDESWMPPLPEETPLGRATLKSAQHIEVVANEIGAVAKNIGNLNQVMIAEVLPQWFRQVQENQKSAEEEARKTSSALKWTKWAVFASVAVTIAATWWQDKVARELDAGNAEHQKAVVELLSNQLSAQQQLIEQQARDAAQLRDALSALQKSQANSGVAAVPPARRQ